MVNVKAAKATLQAGVIHVKVPSFLMSYHIDGNLLVDRTHRSLSVDHHGRGVPSGGSDRELVNRIERLNTRKTQRGL